MKKYTLFCLLLIVLGQTPLTVEAREPTSPQLKDTDTVVNVEEKESNEATSASPASTEEAKKATEEKKSKAIDDFLKDEQKVKNLLQKITDAIGKKLTMKPISQAEVAKNPQAAAMKLQEVYSYYYSGFMSSDVQASVETWIKELLEKIDQTFITAAQKSVATAT